MRRNQYDTWQKFCKKHETLLASTGLPAKLTSSEHRFRELLRLGVAGIGGASGTVSELSTPEWLALTAFTTDFFKEFESYAPLDLFPAFRIKAERRAAEGD